MKASMNSFSELGLARPILIALENEGHSEPTPIQIQAIPQVLAGRDILGIAQTGTGKTAAFALPILDKLARSPAKRAAQRHCRVLVLSPTRELASQIGERFDAYGRQLNIRTAIVIGGVAVRGQTKALANGVDVLIATPGRLMDLLRMRAVDLSAVEVLVLDEADRMLDMGFIHDVRQIAARLPRDRQGLCFSATMPPAIAKLAGTLLTNPVTVAVTPVAKTADRIEQHVVFVPTGGKQATLAQLLAGEDVERALVFSRTKRGADKIVRGLARDAITAQAIHGNKSQRQRERALSGFRSGATRVLIATDIAARGIDVPDVTHVVNYDLPTETEAYVHRIGRTARAGAGGIAISLCNQGERDALRAIEKLIRKSIPVMAIEGMAQWDPVAAEQRSPTRPARRKRTSANPGEIDSVAFLTPVRVKTNAAPRGPKGFQSARPSTGTKSPPRRRRRHRSGGPRQISLANG